MRRFIIVASLALVGASLAALAGCEHETVYENRGHGGYYGNRDRGDWDHDRDRGYEERRDDGRYEEHEDWRR